MALRRIHRMGTAETSPSATSSLATSGVLQVPGPPLDPGEAPALSPQQATGGPRLQPVGGSYWRTVSRGISQAGTQPQRVAGPPWVKVTGSRSLGRKMPHVASQCLPPWEEFSGISHPSCLLGSWLHHSPRVTATQSRQMAFGEDQGLRKEQRPAIHPCQNCPPQSQPHWALWSAALCFRGLWTSLLGEAGWNSGEHRPWSRTALTAYVALGK